MDAKLFLKQNVVIDGHNDLACDVLAKRRKGRRHVIAEDYLPGWRAGGVTCVVSSLFCDEGADYMREALMQINALEEEFAESGGEFFLAVSGADVRRAHETGKVAVMLSFEGVEPLEGDPGLLRLFYRLGVRFAGMCWSRGNWAADGSRFNDAGYRGYGLTGGGFRLLELAGELGVIIDVSHMNELGFWQVIKSAQLPVTASHSDCRAVSDITRNLSDRQIAAIAAGGGVIGINGINLIAKTDDPASAGIGDLVRHMLHIKEVAGVACMAIGLDQCDRLKIAASGLPKDPSFDIIPSHSMLPEFAGALFGAGFTEEEAQGIFGGNLLRLIESAIG